MARDSELVEFLKKESATRDLMVLLAKFNVVRHRSRPFRTDPKELWVSDYQIKVFTERWVKTHRDR
jgi:hypothetical protein